MELLMCRSCGEFVTAVPEGETVVPAADSCPECGDREFKNNATGELIRTG